MTYRPPKQSKLSQLFDVIVLLAMTFGALYIPLFLGLAGGSKSVPEGAPTTWEGMGQNAAQVAQYNALGFTDPAAVSNIINARYDYSFSWGALAVMIVVIVAYYALMLRFSEQEYRDVISEKFGDRP
ncbi:hypothetical protein NX862_18065 [Rhodobacter sp. KR11]|uniref:hypothetical protein n=1 Tax=Rhodobacter sp. KR11 TaxID=2974588 RepID=UPI002221E825|nr:hypothetical protein [Rhodobacter sp. KR11]MCW1920666.1 hypothetical protein [Rhodobacter sp. KR11]